MTPRNAPSPFRLGPTTPGLVSPRTCDTALIDAIGVVELVAGDGLINCLGVGGTNGGRAQSGLGTKAGPECNAETALIQRPAERVWRSVTGV